jgi:hypothetical protein
MVNSFSIAAILTGFDGPVATPPQRRDGLFAVIARYRRDQIRKQGRVMVSLIWIHLEKRRLTKDVRLMSTATDRITQ